MIGVVAPHMRMSGQTTMKKERKKEQKEYTCTIAQERIIKKQPVDNKKMRVYEKPRHKCAGDCYTLRSAALTNRNPSMRIGGTI